MPSLLRVAPELPVSDISSAIEYYENKLGFQAVMTTPKLDYAIVERDSVAIHLFQAAADKHSPQSIHVFTDGLDQLHAELRDRGAHLVQDVVRQPWGNRDFRVKDDFGNEIKFAEPLD